MDNRQCIGLDKFHRCLSTIFPSNHDATNGYDDCDSNSGGDEDTRAKEKKEEDDAENPQPDRDPLFAGIDHHRIRHRHHIPVKFTKKAVELLRETLNAFLRKVGRELTEELDADDLMSRQLINPEAVAKVLLALDCDETTNIDEEDSNGERTTTINSNDANSLEMEQFVSQAQNLLLQRKHRECHQKQELERLNKRKNVEIDDDNDVPDMVGSATSSNHDKSCRNNKGMSGTTAATARKATGRLSAQQQQQKKKKRKRKKIIITADMEAEQDRLLNASKKVFESQQQQQQGGGNDAVTFRVELS